MYRTHNCGELNIKNVGECVILSGWINKIRDLKSIIFIDLRDYYGITQLKFCKEKNPFNELKILSKEFVINIKGIVIERISKNKHNYTGEIEINVLKIKILNYSSLPPFIIEDKTDGSEELRMKYRYLDLRRNSEKNKLIFKNKISFLIREYFLNKGFLEIETPILIKSTPEGARDFLVPSRISPGKFYALPQSPQLFKQLLMIGGVDKYFQIAKCFRDEDLRSDRQPEFSQIDCEMSFVEQNDIINIFEEFICFLFKKVKNINLKKPWPRISYDKSINTYGSDKPDLRFDLSIKDITHLIKCNEKISFLGKQKIVGIHIPKKYINNNNDVKKIINLIDFNIKSKDINFFYIKNLCKNNFKSSSNNIFDKNDFNIWFKYFKAKKKGILLIFYGSKKIDMLENIGLLRLNIAKSLKIIDLKKISPVWIIDFPMFKWDNENQIYTTTHHPFTSPKDEDIILLEKQPEKVKSKSYDLVINGKEIGGGSIRINKYILQEKIFSIINMPKKIFLKKFGFLIEALKYGAPPHGGIAIGLDRLIAILDNNENIREYIAFPKNNSGKDSTIGAPSIIDKHQLKNLHIKIKNNIYNK